MICCHKPKGRFNHYFIQSVDGPFVEDLMSRYDPYLALSFAVLVYVKAGNAHSTDLHGHLKNNLCTYCCWDDPMDPMLKSNNGFGTKLLLYWCHFVIFLWFFNLGFSKGSRLVNPGHDQRTFYLHDKIFCRWWIPIAFVTQVGTQRLDPVIHYFPHRRPDRPGLHCFPKPRFCNQTACYI